MCGRLNCYCKYSSYSDRVAKKLKGDPPDWIDPMKFRPSPNIAPTLHVPVLHVGDSGELVVRPMKWGISLPHVPTLVHNVRIETLSSSKFFQNLMARKQTCAVLCDGFYEWKGKNPFFFYDGLDGFDVSKITEWSEKEWIENGPPVLALAGVYHNDADYSCSVITREATHTSHIHHRITIMLSSKDEILAWLSSDSPSNKLSLLKGIENEALSHYEVHDRVNSSKYQGTDCHVPKSKAPSSGPLDQWFSRSKDVSKTPSDSLHQRTAPENSENLSSHKRKSTMDLPTSHKKSAPPQTKQAGTSRKPPASSPAKNKSGGPLDRWFSKTKKPPEM